ncbi:hypothetical protein MMC13_004041 [Lambiella insularis]|nr:hypothetical protein [Lambiella insularis]
MPSGLDSASTNGRGIPQPFAVRIGTELPAHTNKSSQFLFLPRELRDQIYSLVLLPTSSEGLSHPQQGRNSSFTIDPSILRVNRQIYTEARPYLYCKSSAVFRVDLSSTPRGPSSRSTLMGVEAVSQSFTHSKAYAEWVPDTSQNDPSANMSQPALEKKDQAQRLRDTGGVTERKPVIANRDALRAIRHLEVLVPIHGLWGGRSHKMVDGLATLAGQTLMWILRVLKVIYKSGVCPKKTLTILVQDGGRNHQPLIWQEAEMSYDTKIIQLLRDIQGSSRYVRVVKIKQDQSVEFKDDVERQGKKVTAEDIFGFDEPVDMEDMCGR